MTERVRHLVVGAGVTGLAFVDWLDSDDYLVCEAAAEVGGYCRTIVQDGFVWDLSGHFFHFRNPEIERYLVERMGGQRVLEVVKRARIQHAGRLVDFPFQKNIHQLPRAAFLECLVDLYFRHEEFPAAAPPASFRDMVYQRFGRSIAERMLVPYNEKLYACDLSGLDADAMGRFFPHADIPDIIRNFRDSDDASYNSTFTYPEGGAIQYVHALMVGVEAARVALEEPVVAVDLARKVATTSRREIAFEHLLSTIPFPRLLELTGLRHDPSVFAWNKVLVFNLGFDRKGYDGAHWIYFPDRALVFYRVGFYDNIFGGDRMSLYVEIGYPADAELDETAIAAAQDRVLADLERAGLVEGHRLVSSHHEVLDPAYVHITAASRAAVAGLSQVLAHRGVHSRGRYGSWTYCSIEDNILEARALAESFNALAG